MKLESAIEIIMDGSWSDDKELDRAIYIANPFLLAVDYGVELLEQLPEWALRETAPFAPEEALALGGHLLEDDLLETLADFCPRVAHVTIPGLLSEERREKLANRFEPNTEEYSVRMKLIYRIAATRGFEAALAHQPLIFLLAFGPGGQAPDELLEKAVLTAPLDELIAAVRHMDLAVYPPRIREGIVRAAIAETLGPNVDLVKVGC